MFIPKGDSEAMNKKRFTPRLSQRTRNVASRLVFGVPLFLIGAWYILYVPSLTNGAPQPITPEIRKLSCGLDAAALGGITCPMVGGTACCQGCRDGNSHDSGHTGLPALPESGGAPILTLWFYRQAAAKDQPGNIDKDSKEDDHSKALASQKLPEVEPTHIQIVARPGSNLDVFLSKDVFSEVDFPKRLDWTQRTGKMWCEGKSLESWIYLSEVRVRDISSGTVLAKHTCLTSRTSVAEED